MQHYYSQNNDFDDYQQQQDTPTYRFTKENSSNAELLRVFNKFDSDNCGAINKNLIKEASIYTSDMYDRQVIFDELDKCPSEIDFEVFSQIFQRANLQKPDTSNVWIYGMYDKDKKGFIDGKDLNRISAITGIDLTEEQIEGMLALKNQNSREQGVDFQQFQEIMQTNLFD